MMKLSDNGLKFIAAWEDFRASPYFATKDEEKRGIYTWGFGHTSRTRPTRSISRDEAYALLRTDVAAAERSVNLYAHPSINQAQFDALVDHVINAGDGSIKPDDKTGDFDDMVRAGDWKNVSKHILDFKYQSGVVLLGLVRRTTGRRALFDGKPWDEAEQIGRAVQKA